MASWLLKGGIPVHGEVTSSGAKQAVRPSMAAPRLIAGMVAKGSPPVNRIYHRDRGYERIAAKRAALGARMQRGKGRKTAQPPAGRGARVSKPAGSLISKSAGADGVGPRGLLRTASGGWTGRGFGNPRHSRLGSLRYPGQRAAAPGQ